MEAITVAGYVFFVALLPEKKRQVGYGWNEVFDEFMWGSPPSVSFVSAKKMPRPLALKAAFQVPLADKGILEPDKMVSIGPSGNKFFHLQLRQLHPSICRPSDIGHMKLIAECNH